MTSRFLSLTTAAAIAAGAASLLAAAPATANPAMPAGKPGASAYETRKGNVVQVRHMHPRSRFCRRHFRLGFRLGNARARIIFRRHCRGRHWRGHNWRGQYGYHWHWGHRDRDQRRNRRNRPGNRYGR